MHNSPSNTDFYYALVTFLLQTKQQIMVVASDFGLTSVQALTLLRLRHDDPQSMSGLCKQYECDASNVTGIIDGLEQKGLVSRQPHPNDRRVKLICLEPAGVTTQQKLLTRIAATSNHLFSGLSTVELQQFQTIVQKLGT